MDSRYSKYEFSYIKPRRVKLPFIHDSSAEETFNGVHEHTHGEHDPKFRIP
jgi:hypothetical protein